MYILIIKILYFGLPAIIANSLPVIFARFHWIESLNKPVDNNRSLLNQPLFGRTKTWRGFLVGVVGGIIIIFCQRFLNRWFVVLRNISLIDYENKLLILAGFLMGFGALMGDLVKSFIKRRLKKPEGSRWWPWDIIDSTFGCLIFISLYLKLSWEFILISIFLGPIIHMLSNPIAYKLKIKNVWW